MARLKAYLGNYPFDKALLDKPCSVNSSSVNTSSVKPRLITVGLITRPKSMSLIGLSGLSLVLQNKGRDLSIQIVSAGL